MPAALGAFLLALGPAAADDAFRLGEPLLSSPDAADPGNVSLSFTPRRAGVFDLRTARLDVSIGPSLAPGATRENETASLEAGRFAIGGALDFGTVAISGQLMGERNDRVSRDVIGAAVDVGALTTRMRFVEENTGADGATQRYGVGAEYRAAPGLSIGADLSVEDDEAGDDDRDTQGVVRFRLSF